MISLTVGTLRKSPSTGRRPSSCLITEPHRRSPVTTMSSFRSHTASKPAAGAIQALAALAHTSVPARPGQVHSGDHIPCTRPQAGAWPRRRFRGSSAGLGRVSSTPCKPSVARRLGGIGLHLVPAALAADDQPDLGRGGAAECHRRAGGEFHPNCLTG
jgi:hypothetical protein